MFYKGKYKQKVDKKTYREMLVVRNTIARNCILEMIFSKISEEAAVIKFKVHNLDIIKALKGRYLKIKGSFLY